MKIECSNPKPDLGLYVSVYLLIPVLLWFDLQREWPGYYDRMVVTGIIWHAMLCIVIAAFIYTSIRARTNAKFRIVLIPLLLFVVFQFRILEGISMSHYYDCDMSVCTEISLKSTGIWRTTSDSQLGMVGSIGTFEIKNGAVYLYHDFRHLNPFAFIGLLKLKDGNGFRVYDTNNTWPFFGDLIMR